MVKACSSVVSRLRVAALLLGIGGAVSAAETSWDVHYQPGLAEGRDPLPADPAASRPWRVVSYAQPARTTLLEDALQISTGNDQQPGAGAHSFQMALDEPADRLTLAIEVAADNQGRAEHFAGGLLLGSGSKFAELKLGSQVALLSPAAGGWTRGDYSGYSTFWLTLEKQGEGWRLALYHQSSPEPLQVNDAFFGPVEWIRLGDYSTGAVMNGVTRWRSIRWKRGEAMLPPWARSTAASSGPVLEGGRIQILEAEQARSVSIQRVEDAPAHFSFILNSGGQVRLVLQPRRLVIQKGQTYWVNSTQQAPFQVQAAEDGLLQLTLGSAAEPLVNARLQIEPIRGTNQVLNPSFEMALQTDATQPDGWRWRTSRILQPTLAFGHEMIEPAAAPELPAPSSQAQVSRATAARTGRHSLRIHKPQNGEEVVVELSEPFPVEAGETYLVEGFYQLENYRLGGAAHLMVELTGPGQQPRFVRDTLLNPLVDPGTGAWQRSFFRAAVPEGYTQARLRLSLRGSPLTMLWDDFSFRPAPAPLAQLPAMLEATEAADVMGGDEVRWRMAQREPLEAWMDNSSGVSVVHVNGKPLGSFGFVPGPNAYPLYGMHRQFGDAGIQIQWMPVYAGDTRGNQYGLPLWQADGSFNFSFLEKQLSSLLQRDIDARVMLYLNLDPPQGFVEANPEAAWINLHGDRTIGTKGSWRVAEELKPHETLNFSYTAEAYRRQGSLLMEAMGAFLAQSPLGKAVIGVHLGGGSDGQFFAVHYPAHGDRSEGSLQSYRKWLEQRYGHVQALRDAWQEPAITFESVQFPQEAERHPDHFYLQPRSGQDRKIIDWNLFIGEGVVETLDHFGQAWKRGVGRRSLVTTYYNDAVHGQDLGKEALGRLLESRGIDGAISVVPYGLTRALGRYGALNSLVSSFNLHNKLFLAELDYRSNWAWLPADAWQYRAAWGVPTTTAGWGHQLRRDLGQTLTLGGGAWLYGLGGNVWRTDDYQLVVREAARVAQLQAESPVSQETGQIAVFVDEHVLAYSTRKRAFGPATAVTNHASMRAVLSHSGLSWDRYLLSDLEHPNLPDYRLVIFLSTQTLTDQQIQVIQDRFQREGRLLVFLHGVGTSHPEGFEAVLPRVSGIQGRMDVQAVGVRRYLPTRQGRELAPGLEELFTETRSNLFWVDDPEAEVLATLTGTPDKAGLAIKRAGDWTGVYSALPGGLSVPLLRYLAEQAGITPLGPAQDVTYAGRGLLVIHAVRDGEKTLQWDDARDVLDLTSGQIVARQVRSITLPMQAGETRWFRLQEAF